MIKYINRIIYSVIIAVGVILTYNYTDSNLKQQAIKEIGQEAVINNDYSVFMPTTYYNNQPLYDQTHVVEGMTLKFMVHEVIYITVLETGIQIDEGIYIMIHQLDGPEMYRYQSFTILSGEHREDMYLGVQVSSLPIYMAIKQETASPFINKNVFVRDNQFDPITGIEFRLEDYTEPNLVIPLDIQENDFVLKAVVQTYYDEHQRLPETAFGILSITPRNYIDTTKWVLINVTIYMGIAAVVTYFIFTYQKPKLGKGKLTPGLNADVNRIKKSE